MVKSLKKELYYISRMNNWKISALLIFLVGIINLFLSKLMDGLNEINTTMDNISYNFVNITEDGFLAIFIVISTAIFVCYEYQTGYIKNIYNNKLNEEYSMFSKSIVLLILVILYCLAALLASFVFGMFNGYMKFGNISDFFAYMVNLVILNYTIANVTLMLGSFVKKSNLVMWIGLSYVMILGSIIWVFVDNLLKIEIEKYLPLGMLFICKLNNSSEYLLRVLLLCLVYSIISLIVSKLLSKRKLY